MRLLPVSLALALALTAWGCCQSESKFEHGKDGGVSYASGSVAVSGHVGSPPPPALSTAPPPSDPAPSGSR